MKQLHVFYRIFHDDLIPKDEITPTLIEEYKNYLYDRVSPLRIHEDYNDKTATNLSLRFHFYEKLVENNIRNFKEWLYQQIFVILNEEAVIRKLVSKCQVYIKIHLEKIKTQFLSAEEYKNVFSISEGKNTADIFKLIYQHLTDLYCYLENTFRHYLDENIVVPSKQHKRFIEKNRSKTTYLLERIQAFEIDKKIEFQITEVLKKFMNDGFANFTHAQMAYCNHFIESLLYFFNTNKNKSEDDLLKLLIQLNFNRNGILLFLFKNFRASIDYKNSKSERLTYLHQQLKLFNQFQVCSKCSYNKKVKSLHIQCIDWLEYEIETLSLLEPYVSKIQNNEAIFTKINTNFSVGEMALILKLLQEGGVVKTSKSNMFRAISKHFKSKNSASISSKSLSNSYYDITESNKKSVKRILNQMLTTLDVI